MPCETMAYKRALESYKVCFNFWINFYVLKSSQKKKKGGNHIFVPTFSGNSHFGP